MGVSLVHPPVTVLAVDDETDILRSVAAYLKAALPHVRLVTATSVVDALRILEKERIDVLVTDYRMPEGSGLDLLRRSRELNAKMGRILMTAYADLDLAVTALNEARVDRFLTKPVDAEDLGRAIQELAPRP
ncbi:MAG: response regulator [Thermoplasmatota archaeon]